MKNKAAVMGRNGSIVTMPKNGRLNVADCRTLDGSIPALNILGQNGYILSVVTNEKDNAKDGIDYHRIVHHVENWIRGQVYSPIHFRYCYHHHAKKCDCRLPKTGLLKALARDENVDLSQSVMFASSKVEIATAQKVGIENIIRIETGKADWDNDDLPIYTNLYEAVNEVISNG